MLRLAGLVAATVLACTFHEPVSLQLAPWLKLARPETVNFLSFLALLALGLFVIVHLGIGILIKRVMWERLTWPVQGLGLLLGGIRGLWWAGLLLWIVVNTGEPYLARSIQERSLFSPRLLQVSHEAFRQVVGWTSGPVASHQDLIPLLAHR